MEENKRRQELIHELEKLHRAQRGWQRLVNGEELDYEVIEKIPLAELEQIVAQLRK